MSISSLGDLSQSFMLQRRSSALRHDLSRLTEELSTGRVSDIKEVLAGNQLYLTELERSIDILQGYSVATEEARILTSSMQTALERVQDTTGKLATDLLLAGSGPVGVKSGSPSENAYFQLNSIISTLNDDVGGQSLFSGTSTNQKPLVTPDELLTLVLAEVSSETTPEGIINAARAWFDDPNGFDEDAYLGSDTAIAGMALSETEQVNLNVRANDPSLKDALLNITIAALADDPTLGLDTTAKTELIRIAGVGLQSNQDAIIDVRAKIGFAEERIQLISVRNTTEETSAEFSRNRLIATDPFETATELENVQFFLQGLYSVTVKSSQLSLVNFL